MVQLDASPNTVKVAAVGMHVVTSLVARPLLVASGYGTGDVDVLGAVAAPGNIVSDKQASRQLKKQREAV